MILMTLAVVRTNSSSNNDGININTSTGADHTHVETHVQIQKIVHISKVVPEETVAIHITASKSAYSDLQFERNNLVN